MQRGELRVKRMPTAWRSSLYKGCMAISMLWPCGLGCHMLGLHHTACLGTNLIRNHMLQTRSCHAQHLAHTGQVRMTTQNPPATCIICNQHLIYTCKVTPNNRPVFPSFQSCNSLSSSLHQASNLTSLCMPSIYTLLHYPIYKEIPSH